MSTNDRAIADNLKRFESGELSVEQLLNSGKQASATSTNEDLPPPQDDPIPGSVEEMLGSMGLSGEEDPEDDDDITPEDELHGQRNQDPSPTEDQNLDPRKKKRETPAERKERQRKAREAQEALVNDLRKQNEILQQNQQLMIEQMNQQRAQQEQFQKLQMESQLEQEIAYRQGMIQKLQQQKVDSMYDPAATVQIDNQILNEQFVLRDLSSKREFLKTQAQIPLQNTQQQPQYRDPNVEIINARVNEFQARPDHNWVSREFNNQGQPLTPDAQTAFDIVRRLRFNGGDPKTTAFWDQVDEQVRRTLPHRYTTRYGQRKSPPVASNSTSALARDNGSINVRPTDVDRQAFEMTQRMVESGRIKNKAQAQKFFNEYKSNLEFNKKRGF